MDEDRSGCGIAVVVLVFATLIGFIVHDLTVGKRQRCATQILTGEVRRLDWSGGWKSGVLVETDTGSRVIRSRGHLPAVGDRGYVCQNLHWHEAKR